MDKEKLYKLAERYQNKADTAYNAYQETGITRYDTARRNNEDLAEAIRAAAAASDEHNELVHLRGNMADLAGWRSGRRTPTRRQKQCGWTSSWIDASASGGSWDF